MFLSFFLLPTDGEVFGTLTNMQWFVQIALLAAAFLPRAARPGWGGRLLTYAALVAAALTGPVSWLIAGAVGGLRLLRLHRGGDAGWRRGRAGLARPRQGRTLG